MVWSKATRYTRNLKCSHPLQQGTTALPHLKPLTLTCVHCATFFEMKLMWSDQVNDTLTWSDHISFISKKVARSICLLRRLSWFLPQSLLVLFLKSYILPVLDYCDVVWNSCTKKDAQHLESLLNFACRVVLHRGKHESATAARSDLGLTTLGVRRKVHVARLMHKCVHAHSPPYLASLFPLPSSHHHHFTRSSSTTNLPFVRSSFGQHAFSFSGASLWRSLPPSIRDTKSFSQFNIKLFEFFNLTP